MDGRQLAIYILEMIDEVLQKHKVAIPKGNFLFRDLYKGKDKYGIFGDEYFRLEDKIAELLDNNMSFEK